MSSMGGERFPSPAERNRNYDEVSAKVTNAQQDTLFGARVQNKWEGYRVRLARLMLGRALLDRVRISRVEVAKMEQAKERMDDMNIIGTHTIRFAIVKADNGWAIRYTTPKNAERIGPSEQLYVVKDGEQLLGAIASVLSLNRMKDD